MSEVRVVVYDSAIHRMNQPGGDVYRYTARKVRQTTLAARDFAPKRSGYLASRIEGEVRPRRSSVRGFVRSRADYSRYVHEGTGPVIYPHGDYLSVPKFKRSTLRVKRTHVRGQRANPFLERALRFTMRPNSSPFGPSLLRQRDLA